ncbi:hypothetical protein ASAP_0973 [Asaia bogorensis]|uniref:Uncharacterized protein n=1 Tax=Asaia bogorensis TaxID=91915 RepID=A0A060QE84_9PROT|nr:hypothetical protein ASAP_0973 [Asaia bogorensis]
MQWVRIPMTLAQGDIVQSRPRPASIARQIGADRAILLDKTRPVRDLQPT